MFTRRFVGANICRSNCLQRWEEIYFCLFIYGLILQSLDGIFAGGYSGEENITNWQKEQEWKQVVVHINKYDTKMC